MQYDKDFNLRDNQGNLLADKDGNLPKKPRVGLGFKIIAGLVLFSIFAAIVIGVAVLEVYTIMTVWNAVMPAAVGVNAIGWKGAIGIGFMKSAVFLGHSASMAQGARSAVNAARASLTTNQALFKGAEGRSSVMMLLSVVVGYSVLLLVTKLFLV